MACVREELKPGGKFLLLEHVAARDEELMKKQKRWKRMFLMLGDGCHVDRDIVSGVEKEFCEVKVREFRTGLIRPCCITQQKTVPHQKAVLSLSHVKNKNKSTAQRTA